MIYWFHLIIFFLNYLFIFKIHKAKRDVRDHILLGELSHKKRRHFVYLYIEIISLLSHKNRSHAYTHMHISMAHVQSKSCGPYQYVCERFYVIVALLI